MKIVFLGTPEFAVPSLEILVQNGYDVVAVVTAPDKKAGRGLQLKSSAIREYASREGLPVLQPEKLIDPEFLNRLRLYHADLFIVVAFRMLPEAVWTMPRLGTFNLHSSYLPNYRGAAPINRAIMNGEKETGVTTFFLKHAIDTGNIIFREKVAIHPNETAGELHDRLKLIGSQLVLKTVQSIENGLVQEMPQELFTNDSGDFKSAPKIFTADCQVIWNRKATFIHNQVRGLSPFPGAFTYLEALSGEKIILKLYRSELVNTPTNSAPGTVVIENGKMFISCTDHLLEILELQQEGKKRISATEFIRGFRPEKGWKAIPVN